MQSNIGSNIGAVRGYYRYIIVYLYRDGRGALSLTLQKKLHVGNDTPKSEKSTKSHVSKITEFSRRG